MSKWWMPSQSQEIKPMPWLAPAVIDNLTKIVKPHFRVLEHGCGGSTLWFAERVNSVLSFDKKKEWCDIVNAKVNPDRAMVFVGLDDMKSGGFTDKFDLILIDGEPVEDRAMWLRHAPNLVKNGGWVVLDNANRPEYATERAWMQQQAKEYKTFDGNEGGTRYLVTEFYRL